MNIKEILLNTSNTFAFLPIRIGVGLVMMGHGAQKLFGWFEGPGLEKAGTIFAENLGLQPGLLMAALAGGTEFFGGLLLIIGLLTRVAGLSLAVTMLVAIIVAHPSAFFLPEGMEFALTLLLASLTLAIGGAGTLSVDRKLMAAAPKDAA